MIKLNRKLSHKGLQTVGLLALSLGVLSCNPLSSGNLRVSLGSRLAIMIKATGTSCTAIKQNMANPTSPTFDDVSPVYFQIPSITISWTENSCLTVHWVIFKVNSPGISSGTYSCQLAGTSLVDTLFTASSPQNVVLGSGSPSGLTSKTSECAVYCGGVSMVNEKMDSFGTGTVTVYGTYDSCSDPSNPVPITTQLPLDFFYKGTGI